MIGYSLAKKEGFLEFSSIFLLPLSPNTEDNKSVE